MSGNINLEVDQYISLCRAPGISFYIVVSLKYFNVELFLLFCSLSCQNSVVDLVSGVDVMPVLIFVSSTYSMR